MLKHASLLCLSACLSSTALASELELGLSDDVINAEFRTEVSQQATGSLQWLHHDTRGDYFTIGLHAHGVLPIKGQEDKFKALMGVKAFTIDSDGANSDGEGQGIALGGKLIAELMPQISIEAGLHYSPSVTSFADVDHILDMGLQVNFQPFPGAAITAGYRNIEVDIENQGDAELHEGLYMGLKIIF